MPSFKTLDDLGDLTGKVALVRVDLNLPMQDGSATDVTRVEASKDTILELADKGAKVLLLAHYGRPKGARNSTMSVSFVQGDVQAVLGREIMFIPEVMGPVVEQSIGILRAGDIGLLENVRFWPGEEANAPEFARGIAAHGDIYVNDAFSASHRAHASTEGLAHHLPAYAGRSMERELKALDAALGNPQTPVAAVVGGAKVSSKLDVLSHLVGKVQHLIIGGGMANTFLAAQGLDVGKSLAEHDMADTARQILTDADEAGCGIILPHDVVVAREFRAGAESQTVAATACPPDAMILDTGPDSVRRIVRTMDGCRTLVWNGPLGAFEIAPFDAATNAAASHAAERTRDGRLVSVAGGGDTVSALNRAGAAEGFTYVSSAGGAFLEWMEGKTLPGVAALGA